MVKLNSFLAALLLSVYAPVAHAYVFIRDSDSGEALRLNVAAANPNAVFHISGDAPAFKNKEAFLDGKYAQLSDAEFFRALVLEAMKRWNEVEDSFVELTLSSSQGPGKDPEDKINSIGFSPGSWSDSGSAMPMQGKTEQDSRYIVDCDIIMDSETDTVRLAHVVLHELGHCLGLGHPHYSTKAVMSYATSKSFQDKFELALDDIAGVTVLYPVNYQARKNVIPACGSLAGVDGERKGQKSSPGFLLAVLLLPLVPLIRRRRVRRS